MSKNGLHLPGVSNELTPLQAQLQTNQLIGSLLHLVDAMFQVQLRLLLGWPAERIIADMELTAPLPPAEADADV